MPMRPDSMPLAHSSSFRLERSTWLLRSFLRRNHAPKPDTNLPVDGIRQHSPAPPQKLLAEISLPVYSGCLSSSCPPATHAPFKTRSRTAQRDTMMMTLSVSRHPTNRQSSCANANRRQAIHVVQNGGNGVLWQRVVASQLMVTMVTMEHTV